MEYAETFLKLNNWFYDMIDPKNRLKLIGIGLAIYTLIISWMVFSTSMTLFALINLSYEQKISIGVVLFSSTVIIGLVVDLRQIKYTYSNISKILSAVSPALGKLISTVNPDSSNSSEKEARRIHDSLMISYSYSGKNYVVYVPYSRRNLSSYIGYTVHAEYIKDAEVNEINITQQPGVAYLISPSDIGANKIYSLDNNEKILKEVYNDVKFVPEKRQYDE